MYWGYAADKITHTSTSIWAMPVRSSAPIVLRYSVSLRGWAHAKLIRQIALTVTWTERKSSNAASLAVMPAADHCNFRADFLRTVRKLGLIGLRSLRVKESRKAWSGDRCGDC